MKFSTHAVATTLAAFLVASASAAGVQAEQASSDGYVEQLRDLSETAALLSSSSSGGGGGIPFFAFCGAPSSGGRTGGTAAVSTSVVEGCLAMEERIHDTLGQHEFYGDAVLGQVQNQPAQHWQYHNGFLKTTGIFDFKPTEGPAGNSNSWSAQVQTYCLGLVDTKIAPAAAAAAAAATDQEGEDKMYAVRLVECPPEAETLDEQASTNNLKEQRHLKWLYKPQTGQIESLVEVESLVEEGEDSHYCLTWSTTGGADQQQGDDTTAATTVVLQECAAPTPHTDKHQRQKFVAVGSARPFVLPLVEGSSQSATVEVAYFTGIEDSQAMIDLQSSSGMSLEVVLEDVTNTFNQKQEEEDSVVFRETLDGLDHAGVVSIVESGDIVTEDTVMTVSMNLKTFDEGLGDELPSSSNTHVVFISTFDVQSSDTNNAYSCSVTVKGILIAFGALLGLAFLAVLVNMTFFQKNKTGSVVTPTTATTTKPAATDVDDDDDDDGTVHSVSEASSSEDENSTMVGV
mmetsp:Transcript_3304/g.7722  ORF Transcript_3304/g.7722 Transcript_3304/m.7722 type:complete len:515 (-) Transcript_3304:188-1732(-)|eukprot:CAMPEP_0113462046 /NCGR_PEP_ID=MMETSP0014_2-20120614/11875_1 /TAXON_ID=2857 /ORGANISM="Nitzschia sp." /LENGTH=514 /DNA_ID=CAMNT_0000353867 /DNA_START=176 /DNA_END=1720 /DNA_ORIENTATION=+ /assembly_acc=CAM_ASM_000159